VSDGFPKTALLSVADETGIVELAQALVASGYRLLASGRTAKTLERSKIAHSDVSTLSESPEYLTGRLRLLDPRLFAGIIADRRQGDQMRELDRAKIPPIDIVAANLYPLSRVLESGTLGRDEVMDFLDVAGSALLRAAARNPRHVVTLCDPADYPALIENLSEGKGFTFEKNEALAAKAFNYISYYDSTVAQYMQDTAERLPEELIVSLKKRADLRYGANPQQEAALYSRSGSRPWGLNAAELLAGNPLSFNHFQSMDRALELVGEFQQPACAIVKYGNPAGVALAERLGDAARWAYESDPAGCTGGVAAFNRDVDGDAAQALAPEFLECVVAPDFSGEALDILRAKKGIRLIRLPSLLLYPNESELKSVSGAVLIQQKDIPKEPARNIVVTKRTPTDLEGGALDFAWRVAKHAATHAAVITRAMTTLGIGAGQVSRLDALRLAVLKSEDRHPVITPNMPLVLATDGPVGPPVIRAAADAGVSAVIQPGGSSDDEDAISAADERRIAMVFTKIRHYRH